jgi:hypothetical protein
MRIAWSSDDERCSPARSCAHLVRHVERRVRKLPLCKGSARTCQVARAPVDYLFGRGTAIDNWLRRQEVLYPQATPAPLFARPACCAPDSTLSPSHTATQW